MSATERRGVMRAGRWASRALLVLSGAAAGTAAAWMISGATASADTAIPVDGAGTTASVTPVTDAAAAGLHDVSHGAAQLVGDASGAASASWRDAACQQDANAWSLPSSGPGKSGPGESGTEKKVSADCAQGAREHGEHRRIDQAMADGVTDATGDFVDNAVIGPVQNTLGAVEHIVRKPQDADQVIKESLTPSPEARDFGKKVWKFFNPGAVDEIVPLPELPSTTPGDVIPEVPAADPAAPTVAETPAAIAGPVQAAAPWAGTSAIGNDAAAVNAKTASHSDSTDLPTPLAPAGLPFVPLTAPSVPGGGFAPGGHFDAQTIGVPAWSTAFLDNAKASSVHAGVRHMPLTPGSQPGVTPD